MSLYLSHSSRQRALHVVPRRQRWSQPKGIILHRGSGSPQITQSGTQSVISLISLLTCFSPTFKESNSEPKGPSRATKSVQSRPCHALRSSDTRLSSPDGPAGLQWRTWSCITPAMRPQDSLPLVEVTSRSCTSKLDRGNHDPGKDYYSFASPAKHFANHIGTTILLQQSLVDTWRFHSAISLLQPMGFAETTGLWRAELFRIPEPIIVGHELNIYHNYPNLVQDNMCPRRKVSQLRREMRDRNHAIVLLIRANSKWISTISDQFEPKLSLLTRVLGTEYFFPSPTHRQYLTYSAQPAYQHHQHQLNSTTNITSTMVWETITACFSG